MAFKLCSYEVLAICSSLDETKKYRERNGLAMKKPNIVFIYIDDMGCKDLSCLGSDFYETPNIDRLAKNGVIFKNGYAACPVCSPSRASALTGKYPAKLGVTDWIDCWGGTHPRKGKLIDAPYLKHLPKNEKTVAHYLKDAGYATWHVGKWHLGDAEFYPEHFGFDVNIGGFRWGSPAKGYFSPYNMETLSDGPDGEYLTDRITDEALKLINSYDPDKPFYLNLWHYAVHTPIEAKAGDVEYFRIKAFRMGLDRLTPIIEGECMPFENDQKKRVRRRVVQSDPTYAAMILNLDQNIGRVIDAIEKLGQLEDTVFIFSSDNGGLSTAEGSPTCNLPFSEGKGWTKEGGLRVPFFISQIGTYSTSVCETRVTSPDIFSTILDVAGLSPDDSDVDGVSLVPCLTSKSLSSRPLFWHYPHYGNQGGTPAAAMIF